MKVTIKKSSARGSVTAPASKSYLHRLLICSALADGTSIIRGATLSDDVTATANCLAALGAAVNYRDGAFSVRGTDMKSSAPSRPLNAIESGSTLRFLIPIAAISGARTLFFGSERLMKRPLSVYEKLFEENNMLFAKFENRFLSVDGPLKSGIFTLDGSVSSQFISGLLFALPLLDGDSTIIITPPFESRPYVDMTLDAMKKFGVSASFDGEYTIRINGAQKYVASEHTVEGDWSAAAFIYALSAIGGDVSIDGLNEKSLQGDMVCQELFERLKARDRIIDISNCPDLAPILFSLASYFGGARFTGTRRLKDKESSRAEAMAEELAKFGISVTIDENSVTVNNGELHSPSEPLASHNDHRITMALAILLTAVGGEIEGAESVMKSYPNFFDDLKSLGIELTISE